MIRHSNAARVAIAAFVLSLSAGLTAASAETPAQNNSGREAVDAPAANAKAHVAKEQKPSENAKGRAHEAQAARKEPHAMAAQNGGHATPPEQGSANQQDNGNNSVTAH
jgi:hypothetical protein